MNMKAQPGTVHPGLWDDGIIDPADTRRILALSISMSLNKKFGLRRKGVYRM